jgi:glycosyltransferase involved in cell wall biosynthesis
LRPGFSGKKLLCDIYLFGAAWRQCRKQRYDLIHAVEESAFMALVLSRLYKIPFVYDMDSSMVTQILDKFSWLRLVEKPLRYLESLPMRRAAAVVPVCQALADDVVKYRQDNIVIIKDVSLLQDDEGDKPSVDLRTECDFSGKMLLYIGNLESYQGIDLLLQGFQEALKKGASANLVIIGGEDADIAKYKQQARNMGIADQIHFLGKRSVSHIGHYMAQADVLVSPRIHGVNTPMKVYTYLHSGVAVLATALPTHTQVMSDEIAKLAEPNPEAFADAMIDLLNDDELRARLGDRARVHIEEEHSYPAFKRQLYALYGKLEPRPAN